LTFLSYKLAGIGWHVTAADSRGLESRLWPPACGGLICLQAGDFLTTQLFLLTVACTFSCMMKFTVKDCDPTTGETDDEGYEDEYVVSLWEAHLVLKITEQLPMGADNQTKSCCFGLQFSLKEFFLTYKNTCSCIKRKHEK
jgi:hypothetical protein